MGSNPYVGQLLLVGFSFNPIGWYFCNGQLVAISQNEVLFNLLGTTFGGDGQNTFGLPDLQGRVPVHQGTGAGATYTMGEKAGVESVSLLLANYPKHNHAFLASSQSSNNNQPANNAIGGGLEAFSTTGTAGQMTGGTISTATGGNLPHENRQPLLAMNWIIAFQGIYPSQN